MTLDSLSDFIAAIDAAGELVRVRHPVAARLEMCEISDRAMKTSGGGPALLFENVILDDGSTSAFPVAINLFGSMRRMALSLGVTDLDAIGARITQLMDLKVPNGLVAKLSLVPRLLEVARFPPRVKGGSPPSVPACPRAHWSSDNFSAALNVASKASMRGIAMSNSSATRSHGSVASDRHLRIGPRPSSTTACTSAGWLGK